MVFCLILKVQSKAVMWVGSNRPILKVWTLDVSSPESLDV